VSSLKTRETSTTKIHRQTKEQTTAKHIWHLEQHEQPRKQLSRQKKQQHEKIHAKKMWLVLVKPMDRITKKKNRY
jgi:hypothetical protein